MNRQQQAQRQFEDTRILQKVNAVSQDAFKEKFPRQVDHCLRLVMERLQLGLVKGPDFQADRVATWSIPPEDIHDLAHAAWLLNEIRKGF